MQNRWARMILGSAVLILLVDLAVAVLVPPPFQRPPDEIRDAEDFRTYLRHVAKQDDPWLLIGDSVLAGRTLAERVPNWNRHRLVDYLNQDKNPVSPRTFHQAALDGLLPVDVEKFINELDRIDPAGAVSLVVEMNPRYFSRNYVSENETTRPWINALGADPLPRTTLPRAVDYLRARIPLYRHRRQLPPLVNPSRFASRDSSTAPSALEGWARVSEHYRAPSLADGSMQVQSLQRTLQRLAASGRRTLFFTTPLNDTLMRDVLPDDDYGAYIARLEKMVAAENGKNLSLVNLDAPVFAAEHFLDHAHLTTEGVRLLAVNLLHETNTPLRQLPAPYEMIYPEGPDTTLVWNVPAGFNDGAPWQARFNRPQGIAQSPGGWIYIADTNNHVIRRMHAKGQTVVTWAGAPGIPGDDDGPLTRARFRNPAAIAIVEDTVYVADAGGRRLRSITGGAVSTMTGGDWSGIQALKANSGVLYVLDGARWIYTFDPKTNELRSVFESPATDPLAAFAVSSEELFVAYADNRIGRRPIPENGKPASTVKIEVEASGKPLDASGSRTFPVPFDQYRFLDVHDLVYVERYGGLLVQDYAPSQRANVDPPNNVHLTYLDFQTRMAYPWVKPRTHGAYIMENVTTESAASVAHRGVMTLDQNTAALFYLEEQRSRLYVMNDGLWGLARLGHAPRYADRVDPIGIHGGEYAFDNLRPDRFLKNRYERLPRTGPFVGAVIGSSLTVTSDLVPQYSFGRALEAHIQRRLGYGGGMRYEQMSRMRPALRFGGSVELFESLVNRGARLDAALICVGVAVEVQPAEFRDYLNRLRVACAPYDTLPVLVDTSSLASFYGEGLRAPEAGIAELLDVAAEIGFTVIRPSSVLLRDYLQTAPWGSPPYAGFHASPWAVEAAAESVSAALYPVLRKHLTDRRPAHERPEDTPGVDSEKLLRTAFEASDLDWSAKDWVYVDPAAMQRRYDGRSLEIYVDVSRAGYGDRTDEAALRRLAESVLYQNVVADRGGVILTEIRLTLAVFDNYDEYGQGVLQSARSLFSQRFTRDSLQQFLTP